MENQKTALIAGATGLVGSELLRLLIAQKKYRKIYVPVRRKTGLDAQCVEEMLINFNDLEDELKNINADEVYCCLGTTMKKAGSKQAFYRVDYQYPYDLAKIMKKNGAERFLLVSSIGADPKSLFYYSRVKGDLEEALKEIGFRSLVIFRPSLLLGERDEKRTGEDIAKNVYKAIDKLFVGPLAKYAGIEAHVVASAMLAMACKELDGCKVLESDEIRKAGKAFSR